MTMANFYWLFVLACLLGIVPLVTSTYYPHQYAQENYSTSRNEYVNPVRLRAPDPSIVYADGAYSTVYTSDKFIQMTRAKTLNGLLNGETRVFWNDTDPERSRHLWAPEIHHIDGMWYVFYSSCDIRVPCCETCKTRVLKGCKGPNPYDCDYSYLATLVPETGRQGGLHKDESFSIDGTYLEIPRRGRYHVVSARDPGGLQSITITELDTRAWVVKEWHVISSPDQSVSDDLPLLPCSMLCSSLADTVTVGGQRHGLSSLTWDSGSRGSTACTFGGPFWKGTTASSGWKIKANS